MVAWRGDFAAAATLVAEEDAAKRITGVRVTSWVKPFLAGYEGRPLAVAALSEPTKGDVVEGGGGLGAMHLEWAKAILYNGLCRYSDAFVAAERTVVAGRLRAPTVTGWVLPELIEAAVRSGRRPTANGALQQLTGASLKGSDWAAGVLARSRALLCEGGGAEDLYIEAVDRLSRTPLRPEIARARLLYGEWLRREGRRVDARHQLRRAYDVFDAIGAEAFAKRARRELLATGETVRKRQVDTVNDLTPQEERIARLARDGLANSEIGTELFLSVRTVEWHLRKVFAKLGITSRRGLREALPARSQHAA
jgi:DNA-binding CsgD family transcriptional regulator